MSCPHCKLPFDKLEHKPQKVENSDYLMCEKCYIKLMDKDNLDYRLSDSEEAFKQKSSKKPIQSVAEAGEEEFPIIRNTEEKSIDQHVKKTPKEFDIGTSDGKANKNKNENEKDNKVIRNLNNDFTIYDEDFSTDEIINNDKSPINKEKSIVIPKSNTNPNNLNTNNASSTSTSYGICEKHKKEIEAFCASDQSLLCVKCIIDSEHKTHNLMSIDKAVLEAKTYFSKNYEISLEKGNVYSQGINSINIQAKIINEKLQNSLKENSDFFAQLYKTLKLRETFNANYIKQIFEKPIQILTKNKIFLDSKISLLEMLKKEKVKFDSYSNIDILKNSQRAKKLMEEISDAKDFNNENVIDFIENDKEVFGSKRKIDELNYIKDSFSNMKKSLIGEKEKKQLATIPNPNKTQTLDNSDSYRVVKIVKVQRFDKSESKKDKLELKDLEDTNTISSPRINTDNNLPTSNKLEKATSNNNMNYVKTESNKISPPILSNQNQSSNRNPQNSVNKTLIKSKTFIDDDLRFKANNKNQQSVPTKKNSTPNVNEGETFHFVDGLLRDNKSLAKHHELFANFKHMGSNKKINSDANLDDPTFNINEEFNFTKESSLMIDVEKINDFIIKEEPSESPIDFEGHKKGCINKKKLLSPVKCNQSKDFSLTKSSACRNYNTHRTGNETKITSNTKENFYSNGKIINVKKGSKNKSKSPPKNVINIPKYSTNLKKSGTKNPNPNAYIFSSDSPNTNNNTLTNMSKFDMLQDISKYENMQKEQGKDTSTFDLFENKLAKNQSKGSLKSKSKENEKIIEKANKISKGINSSLINLPEQSKFDILQNKSGFSELVTDDLHYSVYFFGGKNDSLTRKYNMETKIWGQFKTINVEKSDFVTLYYKEKMYFILGGKTNSSQNVNTSGMNSSFLVEKITDYLELFNVQNMTIERLDFKLKSPRCSFGGAFMKNKLFVCGGFDGKNTLDTLEYYDTKNDQWISLPRMNKKRKDFCCVQTPENCIYVMGGTDEKDNVVKIVEKYDLSQNSWFRLRDLNQKRKDFCAVYMSDGIYVLGGDDGNQYLKSVEKFDFKTKKWVYSKDMNVSKASFSSNSSIDGQYIFTYGGFNGKPLNIVERFDLKEGKWEIQRELPKSRYKQTSIVLREEI